MRILRVVHRLYPPTVGGLSYHAHVLSADQARLGHEVVVLTTQEGGLPSYERRDGYEIHRFKSLASPIDNPLTLSVLPKLLIHEDFDILHAHSHLMFTTWLAAIKKHLSTRPFVITNHGFRVKRGRLLDYAQDMYLSSLGRFSLTAADRVISFTSAERMKTVMAGVPSEKSVVIPNGVDTDFFSPTHEQTSPRNVLWTGRYVREKGIRYLIEAAKIVSKRFPDSKFILVGGGEELPSLVQLRDRLGVADNVIFLPEIDQTKLLSVLNRCTVFVLPSLSEGFPSSVLEAMSCQKPVVATGGIGLEEVIGDAGLYVPPRNSQTLANAIATVLGNQDLARELGKRGRKRVLTHYDWKHMVSEIDGLFERTIDESDGKFGRVK